MGAQAICLKLRTVPKDVVTLVYPVDMIVGCARTIMVHTPVLAFLVSVSFVLQGCEKTNVVVNHGQGGGIVVESYYLQPSNDTTSSIQQSESDEFAALVQLSNESTAPNEQPQESAEFDESHTPVPALRGATSASTPQALVVEAVALCGFPLRGWVV